MSCDKPINYATKPQWPTYPHGVVSSFPGIPAPYADPRRDFPVQSVLPDATDAPIQGELRRLISTVEGVRESFAILVQRLEPVLTPAPPMDGEPDNAVPYSGSAVASDIHVQVDKLLRLANWIESVKSRAEC